MSIPRGLLIVSSIFVLLAMGIGHFFKFDKKVQYNDSECYLLPDISPGSEDIVVVDNNLALVSAGDIDRIFFQSKNSTPGDSGIFAVQFFDGEDEIQTKKIPIEHYPPGHSFHPHGLHYSNTTQRLYAVSHGCGNDVDHYEGIEIFRLVRGNSKRNNDDEDERSIDDHDAEDDVKLVHEVTIESSGFPFGGLNNVVEGGFLGEFYVTEWFANNMSTQCLGNDQTIQEYISVLDMVTKYDTKVLRCLWDVSTNQQKRQQNVNCEVVADGLKIANGISANPDKTQIYVADTDEHNVHIYDRTMETGSLTIKDIVPLPHGLDNVEYDVASGKLTASGSPFLHQVIRRLFGMKSVQVAGGMISIEMLSDGTYKIEDVIMHNGSKLSMTSSAVFIHDKILLGSPASDGVLVCPIPDKPLVSKIIQGKLSHKN